MNSTDLDYTNAGIYVHHFGAATDGVYVVLHDGSTWHFPTHRQAHEFAIEHYLKLVNAGIWDEMASEVEA